jgi:hypothetical protein
MALRSPRKRHRPRAGTVVMENRLRSMRLGGTARLSRFRPQESQLVGVVLDLLVDADPR